MAYQFQIESRVSSLVAEMRNLPTGVVLFSDQLSRSFGMDLSAGANEGAVIISNDGNVQGLYSKTGIISAQTIQSAMNSYFSNNQKIVRNSFGLYYQYVPTSLASLLKIPEGVLIKRPNFRTAAVVPGSPAQQSGILEGDIITKVDGTQINFDNSFEELINKHNPNEVVSLELHRGLQTKVINIIVKAK